MSAGLIVTVCAITYLLGVFAVRVLDKALLRHHCKYNKEINYDHDFWFGCGAWIWPAIPIVVIPIALANIGNNLADYIASKIVPEKALPSKSSPKLKVSENYRQPPHCSKCGDTINPS